MTTNQTFDGLAFPVARVRYSGPTDTRGGRYNASLYRDRDRTYRASVPYGHDIGGGARGALPAALKVLECALVDITSGATVADYVAIPGDYSDDAYVFTFVPAYFFDGRTS
jgi:hypothetical protein